MAKSVWLVLGIFLAVSPVLAGDEFGAGYTINLIDGDDHWQVQTVDQTPKDEPIEHQFGKYRFSMTIREISEQEFTLLIDVEREAVGLGAPQSLLRHEFAGTFDSILEFEASNEFLEASGAISVGVIAR